MEDYSFHFRSSSGVLSQKKPCHADAKGTCHGMSLHHIRILYVVVTPWRDHSDKYKTLPLSQQAFFFVAEGTEISNLRLIKDIINIIKWDEEILIK